MGSTVRLIHWNDAEASARVEQLRAAGFTPHFQSLTGSSPMPKITTHPPDVYVIDLSRLPSHGREVGLALRQRASTRRIPLIFVDGATEKVDRLKTVLPDATYCTWPTIKAAITRAMRSPKTDLVVPKSSMAGYSGTPLPKKLGIKPEMTVGLTDPPDDFAKALGELPAGAKLAAGTRAKRQLTIWFVRSLRDLDRGLKKHVALAAQGPVWIAWPKKTSAIASDVSETEVRETGLSNGLVDYKICAIDATWSGLLFCVRRPKP